MIIKIKALLFSMSTLLVLGASMAVPAVASAATGQSDINNGLCNGANSLTVDSGSGSGSGCTASNISGSGSVIDTDIKNVLNVLSIIVGVVAVIMIIVGGFRYVASGGKQESVTSAKNSILYAIIGLVIVAVAQIIVRFVLNNVGNSAASGS